jgi:iron-sulfur cluster insertion protein
VIEEPDMADTPMAGSTPTQASPAQAPLPRALSLSESAARRVAALRRMEGDETLMLRISVSGGGCSGFQYGFSFDNVRNEDDHVFERDGVQVVVDDVSLDLLAGSEIDFVEDLMGASFQVRNPNASSSCGCGSSFAI